MTDRFELNPELDLIFERTTQLSPKQIWDGWTNPETLKKWFCPVPWKVTDCRIDLRPGGEFYTVMEGPIGEKAVNHGCYLEVVDQRRLIWTGLMTKGFRPQAVPPGGFHFVGQILIATAGKSTNYRAIVSHSDPASRLQHEKMGFQEGWGKAFDQLIALFTK